jgi:RNA polymerase sigma-70 factor, ECF subfamily
MTAAQPHTRARSQVQTRSVEAELSARFEQEVVPLRDVLYRNAFRITRNHADAEDLAQETMTKAFAGFHSFRRDTNMRAWLLRILTNSYISEYRTKRRQPAQYSTEQFTEQRLSDTYSLSSTVLRSAEDQALDSLPDNDIKSAMQALPQRFRNVVYYADIEGLPYQEIAAIMNTAVGTVSSQLHRGRRRLRRLLGEGTGGAGTDTIPVTV